MTFDVAIVGGGPAGLAVALESVARGFSAVVFEKRKAPVDKACGEGLLPLGLMALERLGVRGLLDARDTAPFECITYVQEDGTRAVGRLPKPGGLGIRRTALVSAMVRRAVEAGVVLRHEGAVRAHRIEDDGVTLRTDLGETRARLLVAADGLHSPLRRAEGLARSHAGPRRFGLRRHASLAPWSPTVEVHFAQDVEAYVTPTGDRRVGIAFLWEDRRVRSTVSFDALLDRFPHLRARLGDASWETSPLGAGPLAQQVARLVKHRFVLVGDAAGYVDAITGEGLSLAFEGAATLGALLPTALARGAGIDALVPYERRMRLVFARYARLARLLVWTARRPRLRRVVVDRLRAWPRLFDRVLAGAVG